MSSFNAGSSAQSLKYRGESNHGKESNKGKEELKIPVKLGFNKDDFIKQNSARESNAKS